MSASLWSPGSSTVFPGFTETIDSIAELRTLSKLVYDQVIVSGYYTKGDGGGGVYFFDASDTTSADNGGTIIVAADGGRWKLIFVSIPTVKHFGAKGDGSTDDTAAFQNAINTVVSTTYGLFIPSGVYRLTSTLLVSSALRLHGTGGSPYITNTGNRGLGSWLFFDHTGKGISVDGTGMLSGVMFEKLGTFRTQPTPTVGWTPTAHDFDISIDNADVTIDDVILLNPTKGIKLFNTQAGRVTIKRLRGQPLQIGIDLDECYDLPQISNVHFWPYWQDNPNVHAYTLGNLDAIFLRRVDNPQLLNLFTIFARAGVRITQSAAGTVSKLLLANADFDRGAYGIWVDSTVTGITSSKISNVSAYGETGLAGSKGLFIQGSNVILSLDNCSFDNSNQNAIRLEGSGNFVGVGNLTVNSYDQSLAGFAAFECTGASTIQFAQPPRVVAGGAVGPTYYNTTGTIYSDDNWVSFATVVTPASGSITTLGTVLCRYKRRGSMVDVEIDITITTNGTGAGSVRFTLPFNPAGFSVGAGREANTTGAALTLQASTGSSQCTIQKVDNTYPGANGYRLTGFLSYRV